ncbi:hypothetical protein [[Kitasatospora] papulosa]|uniref:Uncharacterized protein n=1 Tax=[Kitasatospora] papulosa TaxID=1464011 RepID=A0ABZ1KDC2_9ACTN
MARFVDPAGGDRLMCWRDAAREVALEDCGPVRPFPVRSGRRFAPGWWWSATTGRLVHYESGVIRNQVMQLDRDPSVVAIVALPATPEAARRTIPAASPDVIPMRRS